MMPRALAPLSVALVALLLGSTTVSAELCSDSDITWTSVCPTEEPLNEKAERADAATYDCGAEPCTATQCCVPKERCSAGVTPPTCPKYYDTTKDGAVCAALVCTETDCCTVHNTCSDSPPRPTSCPAFEHRVNQGVTCEGGGDLCNGAEGETACCAPNEVCSASLEGPRFTCSAQHQYRLAGQSGSKDGDPCVAQLCTATDCCVPNQACSAALFPTTTDPALTANCGTGLQYDTSKTGDLCADTICEASDCCRPNLTCNSALYDCGTKGSRDASRNTQVCTADNNCAYSDCCIDHPYCNTAVTGYTCNDNVIDADYAPRDNFGTTQCLGPQCTQADCCVRHEQCSAAYPTDDSCDPVSFLKVLLLNPRQYCENKDCQNSDCCEDKQLCGDWTGTCPTGTHSDLPNNTRCRTATCQQLDCCIEHEKCNEVFPTNNSCDRSGPTGATIHNKLLRPNVSGVFSQTAHCPEENCTREHCCQTKDACVSAYPNSQACRVSSRGVFFSRNTAPNNSFCNGLTCEFDECCRAHLTCATDNYASNADCGPNYSLTPGRETSSCPAYKCTSTYCCSEHERCATSYTSNNSCRSTSRFFSLKPGTTSASFHCQELDCVHEDCCQAHEICRDSSYTASGAGCPTDHIPDASKRNSDCEGLYCTEADCCIIRKQCKETGQYPTNASCGDIHSVDQSKADYYCPSTLSSGLPTCQQSDCCIINEICGETMFDTCAALTANGALATINGVSGIAMAGLDATQTESYCKVEKCTVDECCGARERCIENFVLDPTYCSASNLVRRVSAISTFYCQTTECVINECCAPPTTCSLWFEQGMTCTADRVAKPLVDSLGLPITRNCEKDVCEENECCGAAGICATQFTEQPFCDGGLLKNGVLPPCQGTTCQFSECCDSLGECALQPSGFCPVETHVQRADFDTATCPDVACEDPIYCCDRKQQCIDVDLINKYQCRSNDVVDGIEYPWVLTEGVVGKICDGRLCTDTECCAKPGKCSDEGSECISGESYQRTPLTGLPPGGFCKGITCEHDECCQPVPKCGDMTNKAGVQVPTFECASASFAKKVSKLNAFCNAGMSQTPPVYECDDSQCCELKPASCNLWNCEGDYQPKSISISENIKCATPPLEYDCSDEKCCAISTRSEVAGIVSIAFHLTSSVSFHDALGIVDVMARTNFAGLGRIHRSRLVLLKVVNAGEESFSLGSRDRIERLSVASQRRLLQASIGSEVEIGVLPKSAVDTAAASDPSASDIATALKDALQDDTLAEPLAAMNPLFVIDKSQPPTKQEPRAHELMVCKDTLLSVTCAIPQRDIPVPDEEETEFPTIVIAGGAGFWLLCCCLCVVWWMCIKSHNPNGTLLGKNKNRNTPNSNRSAAFNRPQDTGGEYSSDSDEGGDVVNNNFGGPMHGGPAPGAPNLNMSAIGVRINGGSVISSEDSETSSSDDD